MAHTGISPLQPPSHISVHIKIPNAFLQSSSIGLVPVIWLPLIWYVTWLRTKWILNPSGATPPLALPQGVTSKFRMCSSSPQKSPSKNVGTHKKYILWDSLEVPRWCTSNDYPQYMFSWRNKKKNFFWIFPLILAVANFFNPCPAEPVYILPLQTV